MPTGSADRPQPVTAPYARILLATEHTEFDSGAERVAFDLALRWGAPLAAVEPLVTNAEYEAVAPELAERADDEAHSRLERLEADARAARVSLEAVVRRETEAWRAIVAEAAERRADLVVLRRRGRTGFLAKRLVGDMVGKVAMQAPCDVLMVPRAVTGWTRGVLAAVDDATTAIAVARAAARLAARDDLPLWIAGIVSKAGQDAAPWIDRAADAAGMASRRTSPASGAPDAIGRLASAAGADLIVVGRHGHPGAIERLMPGSTAEKLIGHAECPVLVVRN